MALRDSNVTPVCATCPKNSGSDDKTIKLWDAASGQETLTLKAHADRVFSVAFSPDGRHIASGSNDKTIKLWYAEYYAVGGGVVAADGRFSPDLPGLRVCHFGKFRLLIMIRAIQCANAHIIP